MGRHISTRVDEGRKCSVLLAIKMPSIKARTVVVVGSGEKNLLCDPGSELRLRGDRTRRANTINDMEKKKKRMRDIATMLALQLETASRLSALCSARDGHGSALHETPSFLLVVSPSLSTHPWRKAGLKRSGSRDCVDKQTDRLPALKS